MLKPNNLSDVEICKQLTGYGIAGFRVMAGYVPKTMPIGNEPPASLKIDDWRRELDYAPIYRVKWLKQFYGYGGYEYIQWNVTNFDVR